MSRRVRKVEEENRRFNKDWTTKFFMISLGNNTMQCLICREVLKTIKSATAERHKKSIYI